MDSRPQLCAVQLEGLTLSCRIWEGTARPVLALHGLASNARAGGIWSHRAFPLHIWWWPRT